MGLYNVLGLSWDVIKVIGQYKSLHRLGKPPQMLLSLAHTYGIYAIQLLKIWYEWKHP